MLRRISYWAGIAAIGTLVGFSIQFAKAWTEPASAPPAGNVAAPVNVSNTAQVKSGALGVGGVFHGYSTGIFDGNVGIGTATPPNKLHVSGNIGATGWVGAGCEGACESSGGYSVIYANGIIQSTNYIQNQGVYYPGRVDVAGMQGSWYLGSHGSYGLYTNTGLYAASNLYTPAGVYGGYGTGVYGYLNYGGYGGYFIGSGGAFAQNSSGYYAYLGYPGTGWSVYGNGNIYAGGYMQSQVMYDANDGSYYMDPNGTSRMNYGVYNNIYSYGNVTAASTFTFQNEQYSSVLHLNLGEDLYNGQGDPNNKQAVNVGTVTDTCDGNATEPYFCNPGESRTCTDYDYGWNVYYNTYTVYRTVVCKTASVFVR